MKTAVFQIDEGDGTVHLICVPMKNLQSACNLEADLQLHSNPKHRITLLGRYNSVRLAVNEDDAEALLWGTGPETSHYEPAETGFSPESVRWSFALTPGRKIR